MRTLHVHDGQQVKAGDVLLELTSTDLDYRLAIERQQISVLQQQRQRGAGRQETASETQVLDRQLAESLAPLPRAGCAAPAAIDHRTAGGPRERRGAGYDRRTLAAHRFTPVARG